MAQAPGVARSLVQMAPRILYLAGHFMAPPHTTGSARPLALGRRLVADGHEVTLLSTDAHLRAEGITLDDIPAPDLGGVEVELTQSRYDNWMGFTRRKVEFAAQATRQAVRALRHDVDLVYATSTPLTVLGPALALHRLRGTPFVFEVRDVWPQAPIEMGALDAAWQQRAAHALADLGYRKAVHVVALSEGMRDLVTERGVPAEDITVAHNAATPVPRPADPGAADPSTRDDDLARWLAAADHAGLYAGTIGAANDVGWLVDLVDHLEPALDLHLAIVGSGAETDMVAGRLAAAPDHVRDRLRMFSARPKGDLAGALATVDFAVSVFADRPSLTANSPNKVFDAWAHGVPVVINNGGWLGDELVRSGAGLSLPRSPSMAADELQAWLRRDGAVAAAAVAARDLSESTYNWDAVYAKIRAGVTSALAARRSHE